MELSSQRREQEHRARMDTLLRAALLLDLEVTQEGKIIKMGAILGEQTWARSGSTTWASAWDELARMAPAARCIIGHNLVRHDLRVLRELHPQHPLLARPVIDTLVLSPIAFPENPYHRLVKDYKLVRESVNDPVADARQAAILFGDEVRSLAGLRETEPRLYELLHYLLTTPEQQEEPLPTGLAIVFQALGGTRPSPERALELGRELLKQWACGGKPLESFFPRTTLERQALAYTVSWLRVAGSNSVLPPWVRLAHPLVGQWIKRLREEPCDAPECAYCRRTYNAREQLGAFFNFDDFRPLPSNLAGASLQREIVEAGLRNESLLAIMPTGGGKSLCYQLPALVRNQRRGTLTIVISPLQALMKDQVDSLARRTGTPFAAALYGLLTPPERGDVLRRIRLGDVALLYVSPEQLRNRSFRDAIAQREVGCWVFDEAHCLSKWGHDFRPDYLYAGRFIRDFSKAQGGVPPICCFTATAKRDVKEEILSFFKHELDRDLKLFEGGVERENLHFEVQMITGHGKLERIHDLLSDHLPTAQSGSAIVFRATRELTRATAEYLQTKAWSVAHFHAGLSVSEKKRVQDAFLSGELQIICATNAFGMGIDKEDVRLVVHADIPGSLENYLQEAGRAGRDGQMAKCILLYDEEDCEKQFRMEALSELSRHDIAQILRSLRKAKRGNREEVVITTGEILRDEDVDISISREDVNADTKVRTAVSWLERAEFIQRNENVTQVFQARLLVRNLEEAEAKMAALNLTRHERELWSAILREFMNASSQDNLTVDQLALLPELSRLMPKSASQTDDPSALHEERPAYRARANPEYLSARIFKILSGMVRAGLMKRDTLLTAFVRHKVTDHSRLRLDRLVQIDRKLVDLLALEEPDPEGWLPLSIPLLNQRLCDEQLPSSTELVRRLLKSLSEDGRGFAGSQGSLDLRHLTKDTYRVRVRRSWKNISELAEKRRRVASVVLDVLFSKILADTPGSSEQLVEFAFEELRNALEQDLVLRSDLRDLDAALERALMYLHEQQVIILQQGLALFRSAIELRRRLSELAGDDTRGVTVLTYHSLAMRLLGYSFVGMLRRPGTEPDFDSLIPNAVKLLRGENVPLGLESDDVRDRLLAGFQHILVDEYQDIDQPQYELISAIAGRTLDDPDQKLSILAVGDDDQNIYSFRGTNVEFIRRFQQDYQAEVHYLIENYRSTRNIIDAANGLISQNTDRMKTDRPIRINRQREKEPAGGAWEKTDPHAQGKVRVIRVQDSLHQAQAVLTEIQRLRNLGVTEWSRMAVLSRSHQDLAQVRACLERETIPVCWFAERGRLPPLHQIREIHEFLNRLEENQNHLARAEDVRQFVPSFAPGGQVNPWIQWLHCALQAWQEESANAELPLQQALEFFYEAGAESRRDLSYGGGVVLSTVHAAKGMEYDHVLLIGPWPLGRMRKSQEEERRTFYVGLTRARLSLAILNRRDLGTSIPDSLTGSAVMHLDAEAPVAVPDPMAAMNYSVLGLEDIYLSYAARFARGHPVHAALANLHPGDRLALGRENEHLGLFDSLGICVARLSQKAEGQWLNRLEMVKEARVLAMVQRSVEQEIDPAHQPICRTRTWEVPVVEIVFIEK